MGIIEKTPNTKDMEFIALRTDESETVISRGFDVDKVIEKAKNSGLKFILTYKPAKDQNFIF